MNKIKIKIRETPQNKIYKYKPPKYCAYIDDVCDDLYFATDYVDILKRIEGFGNTTEEAINDLRKSVVNARNNINTFLDIVEEEIDKNIVFANGMLTVR